MTANHLIQEFKGESASAVVVLVDRLVWELGNSAVRYCHWKSNRQLSSALAAEDDLDLLISIDDKPTAEVIFLKLGFKQFIQVPTKHFNGIADFIGFDAASGRLVHLHTHYCLTLGDHRLKGYRLPWENRVLATITPADNQVPIMLPGPEIELLLLVIRTCLKVRFWNRIIPSTLNEALAKEFLPDRDWLQLQIDKEKLQELCQAWLTPEIWPEVQTVALANADNKTIIRLRNRVAKCLALYRTYGLVESALRRTVREIAWAFGVVNKRYLQWPRPWGRTSTSGGLIVCVIGADGSGKSTLTEEITRWLRFKLDAISIYMGSGDGRSFFPLTVLKILRRSLFAQTQRVRASVVHGPMTSPRVRSGEPSWLKMARLIWGVVLALEKREKQRRAFRAASRGMIVICDRYPQSQYFDFNDGPLLQDFALSRWGVLRAIAKWELESYRVAEKIAPDLVIKLMVPSETAVGRKPEMRREEIERRNEAIEQLKFPDRTRVVTIPADLPFEEVFLKAKAQIWPMI